MGNPGEPNQITSPSRMPAALIVSFVLMGATSLILQVLLVRELMTSFFGNELSIVAILLNWLLIVALGSGLAGRARGVRVGPCALVAVQLLLSIVIVGSVMLSRAVGGRTTFPGEVVSPGMMLLLSALTVAPGCFLLGAQFALSCKLAEPFVQRRTASVVYSVEALGALIAGILFHFVLADRISPVATCLGLSLLNALAGVWVAAQATRIAAGPALALLWLGDDEREPAPGQSPGTPSPSSCARWLHGAMVLAILCALMLFVPPARNWLSDQSLRLRWRGFELLESTNSHYGNLAVTRNASQVSFYQDGSLLFSSDQLEASEWAAHLPLLQCKRPESVLMIGAGYPATIGQVNKHPVVSLKVYELDPALVRLAGRWLPDRSAFAGATVQTGDARRALHKDLAADKFDAIIVSVHDPTTAALNRYYTREFFRLVHGRLAPDGVLSMSLSSHVGFLTAERKRVHAAVYRALKDVFHNVLVVPGYDVHFIASPSEETLTSSPETLAARLTERGIHAQFVSPFSLGDALDPFNRDLYLESVTGSPIFANSDLKPVVYESFLRMWLKQYAKKGLGMMDWAGRSPEASLWVVLLAVILFALSRHRLFVARTARVSVGIAGAGFIVMGLQLTVLLAFQALAGCIYHQIAILTALNMAGLAFGSWLGGLRWFTQRKGGAMLIVLLGMALLPYSVNLLQLALQLVYAPGLLAVISVLVGILGGAVYPLGVALLDDGTGQTRPASSLYAWDLLGGAFAAAFVGALLIPALGPMGPASIVTNIAAATLLVVAPVCTVAGPSRRGGGL